MSYQRKSPFAALNVAFRVLVIILLALLGVSVVGIAIIGGLPDTIVRINPIGKAISSLFATAFIFLALIGVVSIFRKSLRKKLFFSAAVLAVLLLISGCFNLFMERLSYKTAKEKQPVERLCVITNNKHYHHEYIEKKIKKSSSGFEYEEEQEKTIDNHNFDFRFLDDGTEGSIATKYAVSYMKQFNEGDTCVAYVRDGLFGIQFVTNMRLKARKSN